MWIDEDVKEKEVTTKHTPGPWFVLGNGFCVAGPFSGAGGEPGQTTAGVAHCGMQLRAEEEAEANACLVAAAPDFLDAVTGDVEPDLWQITYAESVLGALALGTWQARAQEDPQACSEAVREALTMCRRLRLAIVKAQGECP